MCCESQRFRLWDRLPDVKRCFSQRNQSPGLAQAGVLANRVRSRTFSLKTRGTLKRNGNAVEPAALATKFLIVLNDPKEGKA